MIFIYWYHPYSIILKYTIICILVLVAITACRQHTNKVVENNSSHPKAVLVSKYKKDTIFKKIYPLTDSGQLMRHLDSLPKPSFPYQSEGGSNQPSVTISLAAFKNKKLFNISLKLIPTELGAGFLDHFEDRKDDGTLPDSIVVTFNLADTVTYRTEGVLVATTSKFVVIDGILVTLSYNVGVIDAIHTQTGAGNNHWQIFRTATIYKDLTMVLHHSWSVETERRGHFEYENEDEHWYIDENGHIRKQHVRHLKKKHR
ncbi:MAG: hypothetical protein V4592_16130 [Bacteroidota bacterium]